MKNVVAAASGVWAAFDRGFRWGEFGEGEFEQREGEGEDSQGTGDVRLECCGRSMYYFELE